MRLPLIAVLTVFLGGCVATAPTAPQMTGLDARTPESAARTFIEVVQRVEPSS